MRSPWVFVTSRPFRHNPPINVFLYRKAKPAAVVSNPLLVYNISGIEFQIWSPACTILFEANTVLRIWGFILNILYGVLWFIGRCQVIHMVRPSSSTKWLIFWLAQSAIFYWLHMWHSVEYRFRGNTLYINIPLVPQGPSKTWRSLLSGDSRVICSWAPDALLSGAGLSNQLAHGSSREHM